MPTPAFNNQLKFFMPAPEVSGRFSPDTTTTASLSTTNDQATLPIQVDELGQVRTVSQMGGASDAYSLAFSTQLTGSIQAKSSAGAIRNVVGRMTVGAVAETMYLQIWNSATPVTATTAISDGPALCAPVKVAAAANVDQAFSLNFETAGVFASRGIYVALSTTEFQYTPVTGSGALATPGRGSFNVFYK